MLACGAVLSLLSISVLVTLIVVQVNAYEARRIADFRRAHNALQIQLARQDASYARLANMAEYAWGHDVRLGQSSSDAMYLAYLQGGQRLVVVADDSSRPQMALGLQTLQWQPQELKRYLQLSAAVSLIQRLTRTSDEGEPVGASYFFDPSGQYLSLDKGLTERSLADALGTRSRDEIFEHLRAPAQLLAPPRCMTRCRCWRAWHAATHRSAPSVPSDHRPSLAGVSVPGQRRRCTHCHLRCVRTAGALAGAASPQQPGPPDVAGP